MHLIDEHLPPQQRIDYRPFLSQNGAGAELRFPLGVRRQLALGCKPMLCFEVSLNGKRLATAAHPENGVLSCHVAGHRTVEKDGRVKEQLDLRLGGLDGAARRKGPEENPKP